MKRAILLIFGVLLFVLISQTKARIINCVEEKCGNICNGWRCECNAKNGYYGWCDDQYNHHCCCREGPPNGEVCTQPEPCHYVCCSWPQKPCGYSCCNPNGEVVLEVKLITHSVHLYQIFFLISALFIFRATQCPNVICLEVNASVIQIAVSILVPPPLVLMDFALVLGANQLALTVN